MASNLYCCPNSYSSSNYSNSNSFRSFTLLNVIAKSIGNLSAIATKSVKSYQKNVRVIILERVNNKRSKQRTDTKNEAKKITSENFTGSIRDKSNIAIAILEKEPI